MGMKGTTGWKTLSKDNALWAWLNEKGNMERFILAFQQEFEAAPTLARKGGSMSMHYMRDKLVTRLGIAHIVPSRSKLLGVVLSFLSEPEQGLFFREGDSGVRFGLTDKGKAIVVEARKPNPPKDDTPSPTPEPIVPIKPASKLGSRFAAEREKLQAQMAALTDKSVRFEAAETAVMTALDVAGIELEEREELLRMLLDVLKGNHKD